jgi:hypothetical protein
LKEFEEGEANPTFSKHEKNPRKNLEKGFTVQQLTTKRGGGTEGGDKKMIIKQLKSNRNN